MDDLFMTFALKNSKEAVECILRIILKDKDLHVVEVIVQDVEPNLYGRGVRLDVHAIDGKGRHFDIEIQRASSGASLKRSRHNGAVIDAETVRKGGDPRSLPDTYIIFICEKDPFNDGLPVYTVRKYIEETGKLVDDGMYYVFSNAEYAGNDDFGRLAHDLKEKDPQKMHFPQLSHATAQAKLIREECPKCVK